MKTRSNAKNAPRQRLIAAATDLFCRYGITAVGVDAIVEKAGTAKTTLYSVFKSKEGLVEAVLEAEGDAWRKWFIAATTKASPNALGRLNSIFPVLAGWFQEQRFYGCPFINAVAEHDKANHRMRDLAIAHKLQVLAYIRDLCAEANARDPDRLTHQLALLIDGAIVTAMITGSHECATLAQSMAQKLVEVETTATVQD